MAIARPSQGVCTIAVGCNTSMSPDTAVDGLTAGYGGWLYDSGGFILWNWMKKKNNETRIISFFVFNF